MDTKELQIACSLIAMPQKTKENFSYDVVDATGENWEFHKGYGQKNGETIHKEFGSYIMGYANSYDFNPRYNSSKAYNVGKSSISASQQRTENLMNLINSRKTK